jgi:hypothetical protein
MKQVRKYDLYSMFEVSRRAGQRGAAAARVELWQDKKLPWSALFWAHSWDYSPCGKHLEQE